MKLRFKGKKKDLLDLCRRLVGQPKVRVFVLEAEGADEPIPKGPMATVRLARPIKPGFRRRVTLNADEPVESPRVEILDGDSTVEVRTPPEGTPKNKVLLFVNGNGAIGTKKFRVLADGHIGEGEATISLDIEYDVVHPDATAFAETVEEESPDEAIPPAQPPAPEGQPAGGGN